MARAEAPRGRASAICPSLDPVEEAAWFGLLGVHAALAKAIDAELIRACQLPLSSFEALLRVARAGGGRLGMGELARELRLSQSGLSRLVDRLEEEGLIRREGSAADARAVFATVTDAGVARLHQAAQVHVDVVRARFLSRFSPAELSLMAEFWRRVAPGEPCAGG
jgi:DNA-binding MarR family transcriptional regulator